LNRLVAGDGSGDSCRAGCTLAGRAGVTGTLAAMDWVGETVAVSLVGTSAVKAVSIVVCFVVVVVIVVAKTGL